MKKILTKLFLFIVILTSPGSAYGEEAAIEDVRVNHNTSVDVSFTVKGALTEEIMEAISSGIPTSFTYVVKLYRQKDFFPDKQIQTLRFNHSVKYDNLKNVYVITLDRSIFGSEDIEIVVQDIEEMKKQMITVDNVSFIPKEKFKSGYTYRLLVKAELDVINLPLAAILDYVLFFVKLWDFETKWYEYKFTY